MILEALRATEKELEDLARAETDPAQYARFEPICRGPVFALLVLAFAGLMALTVLPQRVIRYWFRRGEPEARV